MADVQPVSFCGALYELLTLKVWKILRSKDDAVNSLTNLGLISALLLTMVVISPIDQVGDKATILDQLPWAVRAAGEGGRMLKTKKKIVGHDGKFDQSRLSFPTILLTIP